MKHIFCCVLLVMSSVVSLAQLRRPEGTIVRMSMTKCDPQGGFMAVMSGGGKVDTGLCPEYVLVADKVVHAIRKEFRTACAAAGSNPVSPAEK